jgi:hypothetical protein
MGGLVWIASYPKSGNTWLRHLVHSLIRSPDQSADINELIGLTAGDNSRAWYQDLLTKPFEECSDEDFAAVRPAAIRNIAAAAEGLVFVKTHNAMVRHLGTVTIEPSVTAGAIYVVRNPLDVAISYAHFGGQSIDDTIALMNRDAATSPSNAKQVYQYHGSWSEHVHSWTRKPARQLHVMRYEDMLASPMEAFGRLAQFLRLQVTPEHLAAAIEASSFDKLRAQEDAAGFKERPEVMPRFFRAGRANQWREVLTKKQVDAIVSVHHEEMARFGYLPE